MDLHWSMFYTYICMRVHAWIDRSIHRSIDHPCQNTSFLGWGRPVLLGRLWWFVTRILMEPALSGILPHCDRAYAVKRNAEALKLTGSFPKTSIKADNIHPHKLGQEYLPQFPPKTVDGVCHIELRRSRCHKRRGNLGFCRIVDSLPLLIQDHKPLLPSPTWLSIIININEQLLPLP